MAVVRRMMVVQVSQQTRKIADRVSVICPHYRKRLTFVGQHTRLRGFRHGATLESVGGPQKCRYNGPLRLFEGDSLGETRRRFAERKLYPNGLESNGAGDELARGNLASTRSSLSSRFLRGNCFFLSKSTAHTPSAGSRRSEEHNDHQHFG